MSEPTPLSAEHVSPETWKLLQNAFPAYQDEQLDFVIGLERFQRSALTKLAHWVNPDPECDHCYAAWAQWASEGDGPFTFAQIAYWNTSEVTSGFERRLFATIDAQAAEIAALKGALDFWEAMRECREWANQQFPNSRPEGKAKHLSKEAYELAADPTSGEEMADVLMIFAHLAEWEGVDLASALRRKLAINRQRKWAEPDVDGVIEHVLVLAGKEAQGGD